MLPTEEPVKQNGNLRRSRRGGLGKQKCRCTMQTDVDVSIGCQCAVLRSMSLLSSQSETHIKERSGHICRCFANGFVLKWSGQHGGFPKLADVTGQRATCGGSRCLWESAVSVRFVSHMTGTSTKIGLQIEGYHSQPSEMWKALGPNETQNDRMI